MKLLTAYASIIVIIILIFPSPLNSDEPSEEDKNEPPPSEPEDEENKSSDEGAEEEDKDKKEDSHHHSDESCFIPGEQYPTLNLKLEMEEKETSSESVTEDKWSRLKINRYYGVLRDRFYIQNTDSGILTIQLWKGTPSSDAIMRGTDKDWDHEYVLAKLDIFWSKRDEFGSQHAISGETYPFEVQLVHYKKDLKSLTDAVGKEHGILVVCIVFEVNAMENPPLEALSAAALMSTFPQESMELVHGPLDIKALFPIELSNLQYTGSYMVKPYCTPNAKFVVFTTPREISYKQVKSFREIRDSDGERFKGLFLEEDLKEVHTNITLKKNVKLSILRTADIPGGSHRISSSVLICIINLIWALDILRKWESLLHL